MKCEPMTRPEIEKAFAALNIPVTVKGSDKPRAGQSFRMNLTEHRDRLVIHNYATARPAIVGDKKLRQAVVRFEEPAHTITDPQRIFVGAARTRETKAARFVHVEEKMIRVAKWTAYPPRTKFTVTGLTPETSWKEYGQWKGEVRIDVPQQRTSVLVGIDETHMFISVLPRHANSVEEAHRMLLPEDVAEAVAAGTPVQRQGEWFFVPCTDDEIDKIIDSSRAYSGELNLRDGHRGAVVVRAKGGPYVFGRVSHRRHKPVVLTGWHRAVRNRERVTNGTNQRSVD